MKLEEAHLLHSQIFGASNLDHKNSLVQAYEQVASLQIPSTEEYTGYEVANVSARFHQQPRVDKVCSRCRESTCEAQSCTSACFMCLAPSGHTSTCIFRDMILPPMLKVCTVADATPDSMNVAIPEEDFISTPDHTRSQAIISESSLIMSSHDITATVIDSVGSTVCHEPHHAVSSYLGR